MKKNISLFKIWYWCVALIFVIGKIFGFIDWAWVWVFAPVWIPYVIAIVTFIIGYIISCCIGESDYFLDAIKRKCHKED